MQALEKISQFVYKNMAIIVLIFAVIALASPNLFIWAAPQVTKLLGVAMFGMGMTLNPKDFKEIFRRPWEVFVGLLAQFTIMPVSAYALAVFFDLPPELAAGVVLIGTCPSGIASNIMTYLAKGDLALSVSVTTAATILAPIVTPIFTWILAGEWIRISLLDMILSIVEIVIAPIILGIIINSLFSKFVNNLIKILPLISIIAVLLIVVGVVSVNAGSIMETITAVVAIVILHNLLGYALGFGVARMLGINLFKAKAISLEVGMQNSGLATSLAMIHFGAIAAIPGAICSICHNISGSILANYMAKKG